MKKAVNATTFVALALAASVTYNIVQHQRAKGIRPESPSQEDNAVQSATTENTAAQTSAAAAPNSASATRPASATRQSSEITFRSARYDKYNDELDISFSSPNSLQSGVKKDAVEIKPEVDNLRIYPYGTTLSVSGAFKPGVIYRIRVKKGLADRSGKATLENDAVFDFTVPELTERFSFLTNGSVFPLTADRIEFPYSARNLKKYNLKLYRGFENNLAFASGNDDVYAMELVGEKTVTLSDPRNETVNHMLDLTDILDDRAKISHPSEGMLRFRPGHYVLEVEYDRKSDWSDDYTYRETERRTFTLTDFAMVAASAAKTGEGLAIFVRRISDGKPVADAEIELRTDKNQLVGTYKTDSNGKAFTQPIPGLNKGTLYSAAIRKGEEFAWFPLELNLDDFKSHGDMAFVFTERGIVRPGEDFLAASFIRYRENGSGKTIYPQFPDATMPPPSKSGPSYSPYKISLIAPDGRQILSEEVHGDEMGFLSQMIRVPDTAVSGVYTVRVASGVSRMGETTIRVGAYVPDRIKAKLDHADLPAGPAAVKEPIQAVLSADYYFGTPVPSASGRLLFDCTPSGKRPDHWKGWEVGDASRFNFDEFETPLAVENGKTNLSLPSFGSRGMSFDPVRIVLQASVQEPGGRAVTGADNFTLYPTDWFIGLKQKDGAGSECLLDLALLATEQGKPATLDAGRDIKFTVLKRAWDYVLVQDGGGYRRRWQETVSEVEGASKTVTIPQGADLAAYTSQVAFDLPSGCYDIVAEYGNDIRTKINVWHSAGESGRRTGDPSELVFKTDAKKYAPGETAKITFTSPVDGEAFVTMGALHLDYAEAIPVKAGEVTLDAKIRPDTLNGRYHIGVIVIGKDKDEYIRASGLASLELDHSAAHKLDVAIAVPGIVRPETETDVTVSLANLDGKPQAGQVCLFAVDEGVLALTGFKTPDIYKFFLQDDVARITMCETYSDLFPNLKIRPDGAIGGGDAPEAPKSALAASLVKMKDAARVIVPVVKIPESGSATVKVNIPDHSGSLRFMAVANAVSAVGSGEREMIVRNPVSLTVSAPRVLAPGDEAVITVRAFNHDAGDGAADCRFVLPDTLQVMGDLPTLGALKAGETKDVSFRVKALDRTGEGTLSATLSVGAESRTETTYITVRPATAPQTVSTFALVKPGQTLSVDPAAGFVSVDGAKLSVSSSPAVGVTDALGWLNDYPYGCLEQTVSGAFPFLSSAALAKAGLLDAEIAKTMEPKIASAYARILMMTAGDGAFSMWPDVRREWPEGTVYAAHFIFEAKSAKRVTVDATVEKSLTAYLLRLANSAGSYKPELRAYAAYVLASAGNRDFAIPARNILAGSKPGFASFLAAAALIRGGYAGEGAESLRAALADPTWLYQTSDLAGISDTTSRAGMVLSILMKCDPKGGEAAAAELASFLAGRIRKDGGCWGTTQANAWASMGLAAFAEYYPPAELSATLAAAGKEKQTLSGKALNGFELATSGTSAVSNTGKTNLYVRTVVSGVPKEMKAASGPIRLKREFFDEKGNPVTSLKHGELAFVRITADSPDVVENIVISDLLPAGLEIEDDELATRMNASGRIPKNILLKNRQEFSRTEKRDDRFLVFGTLYGSAYAIYTVRAVTPGKFLVPALHAEAMYDPDMNGTFIPAAGEDVFEVK
jgi:hypothetical protein